MEIIEQLGFYSTFLVVFLPAVAVIYRHIWDYSQKELNITPGSILLALFEQGKSLAGVAAPLFAAVAVGVASFFAGAGWRLSAGYAALTFLIAGIVFPRIIRRVTPKSATPATAPVDNDKCDS
jgi:hypothetical protein